MKVTCNIFFYFTCSRNCNPNWCCVHCNVFHVLPDFVDELASDEDEINEDDVQYIESLAQKVCISIYITMEHNVF